MKTAFLPALVAAFFMSTSLAMAAPNVVATIKPVHSLVASVMAGVGEPYLVVKGGSSPHTYALKPSDAGAIEAADVIFWTGHGMELFLADKVEVLAPNAVSVPLSEASGITLLAPREGGMFDPHMHEGEEGHEEGHDHAHEEEADMHMFLDPQNAQIMVTAIAETLSKADPENAALYAANAEKTRAGLVALEAEIAAALAPVKDKPFVVFHDAYQYFEKRFGLNVAGSITVSPEVAPGAERVAEIHDKLKTLSAACVFAEPQFEPAIVDVLVEGTSAKKGVLDPEGADIAEGPDMYARLMRNLATNLTGCLGS